MHGLFKAESAIKVEKKRQLESDVARTYTIAEMLANGTDSDEDMYDSTVSSSKQAQETSKRQFPWYQPKYETVFDMNSDLLKNHQSNKQGYPQAEQTDRHYALQPKQVQGMSDPP